MNSSEFHDSDSGDAVSSRSRLCARLAAVQQIYGQGISGNSPDALVGDTAKLQPPIVETFPDSGEYQVSALPFDRTICQQTIQAFYRHDVQSLDQHIAGSLPYGRAIAGINPLLRTILRTATAEILCAGAGDSSGLVVADYVVIAHAFFDHKQAGFAHAVLERIAKTVRQ